MSTGSGAILLDTHVVLWALSEPHRLGAYRDVVEDPATTRLLSAVVTWEVAIKVGLGRLDVPQPVRAWAQRAVDDLAASPLPVTVEHTLGVVDLPPLHRDPFNRLLVAQAQVLGVPLLTADAVLAHYDAEVLLVS